MIELAGHPCAVHEPADPMPGGCVILLGDLPERAAGGRGGPGAVEAALWERLVAARIPTLAPAGSEAWWLERVVPSFDAASGPAAVVAGAAVAEATRRFGTRPPGIALVGFGVGGQGALGIAYRRPDLFPVVAAVSPAIDFHLAMRDGLEGSEVLWEVFGEVERARQETAILHVHPLNWPRHQFFAADANDPVWYDGAGRLHGKLAALGVPHEWLLDPVAEGFSFASAAAEAAVAFVVDRLGREARRIA
jgi:acetyl esterase/lipase